MRVYNQSQLASPPLWLLRRCPSSNRAKTVSGFIRKWVYSVCRVDGESYIVDIFSHGILVRMNVPYAAVYFICACFMAMSLTLSHGHHLISGGSFPLAGSASFKDCLQFTYFECMQENKKSSRTSPLIANLSQIGPRFPTQISIFAPCNFITVSTKCCLIMSYNATACFL